MKELPIWVYPDGCAVDNERLPRTQEEFEAAGVIYKSLSVVVTEHPDISKSIRHLPDPLAWACRGCTIKCPDRMCKMG